MQDGVTAATFKKTQKMQCHIIFWPSLVKFVILMNIGLSDTAGQIAFKL